MLIPTNRNSFLFIRGTDYKEVIREKFLRFLARSSAPATIALILTAYTGLVSVGFFMSGGFMKRPFEVGDLVVSEEYGLGTINGKTSDNFAIRVVFENYEWGYLFFHGDDLEKIKTIRRPRKGSKEARDIVAMLAREWHKRKHEFGGINGAYAEGLEDSYLKAKEMLK